MNDYVTKKDFNEFKEEIKEEFRRHTGILIKEIKEFQKRINFVIDGQDVLTQRVDNLETKVDKISDELLSHRNNTELHAPVVKQKGKKQA